MSIAELNQLLNDWVLNASGAWWVLPVIFLCCFADGFFPVLPSESLIVALASVWASQGLWHLAALALVGGAGAFLGDQVAYRMGRAVGIERFGWMRRPRVRRMFAMAQRQLDHRGAVLIFTARYVPVGRVAVNFTAGATGFSLRKFTFFDALGCLVWGAYSVAIGAVAGAWFEHNKVMGIVISIAIAIALGWCLDRIIHRLLLRFRPESSVLVHEEPLEDGAARVAGDASHPAPTGRTSPEGFEASPRTEEPTAESA